MATVKSNFDGKVDILVNNAGQSQFKLATECTRDDYTRIMTTNLESCFHLRLRLETAGLAWIGTGTPSSGEA
ncbi:unnamed protein product [Urochloa humidicola]